MPPLRDAVLTGRFLGAATEAGAALAEFLTLRGGGEALRAWFGAEGLLALLAGADTPAAARARLEEAADRDIAALDRLLSAQVDALLHQPRLRRLEGSWRGLHWLVQQVPPASRARVRVLPLRWHELCRDLERAVEFDQSQIFRKIYEEEFGTPGGEPYGLIAVDHDLRHMPASRQRRPQEPQLSGQERSTDDVRALADLTSVAAAAFAPTVIALSPAVLGLENFAEGGAGFDPADIFRSTEWSRFRDLQRREDTRFLGLLLPRLLGRVPYADDGRRADGFRYRESAAGPEERVWQSPVYAFAAVTIRAFLTHGWPADIRGAEPAMEAGGGIVLPPALERLASDPPGPPPRPPVELALTDRQERQVAEAGLIPLAGLEGLPEAAFAAVPSFHRPPRMNSVMAEANQRLSAQFNAMLCVSRIAHCVKIMGRDMVGAFRTAEEIEFALQRWLGRLTSAMLSGPETAARFPLLDSRVEVREQPGRPGVFSCVVHLQPHYQLDEIGAAFRLVTDLQAPRLAA